MEKTFQTGRSQGKGGLPRTTLSDGFYPKTDESTRLVRFASLTAYGVQSLLLSICQCLTCLDRAKTCCGDTVVSRLCGC